MTVEAPAAESGAGQNIETQQEQPVNETQTGRVEPESKTATEVKGELGEAAPQSDAAVESLLAKQSKDLARMAGALKNLQAENATLKGSGVKDPGQKVETQFPARGRGTDRSSEFANHPALQGQEWGETDSDNEGLVLVDGTYITPQFAIRLHSLESKIVEYDQWRQSQESKAHDAKVQAAQKEFFDAVSSTMTVMLKEAMPTLVDKAQPRVQKLLLQEADALFNEAMKSGEEISENLIQRVGKQALQEVRETLGILGEQQFASNREAAEKDKTRPGHVTGVAKGKRPEQMTSRERDAYADALSEMVRRQKTSSG